MGGVTRGCLRAPTWKFSKQMANGKIMVNLEASLLQGNHDKSLCKKMSLENFTRQVQTIGNMSLEITTMGDGPETVGVARGRATATTEVHRVITWEPKRPC